MRRRTKPPEIKRLQEIRYLTQADIQREFHIGYARARDLMAVCKATGKLTRYEDMTRTIHWKKVMEATGLRDD